MNGFFRLTAKGATGDITLSDAMISTTGVGSINLLADRNIVVGRMSSQNGSVTGTAGIVGGGSVTTGGVFSLLTTVTGSIIFTQNGAAGQISLGGDAYTFVDGGISLTAAGAGITSRTLSAGGNGSVQLTANTTAGASYTAQPFSYIFTNTGSVGVGVAQNVSLQSVMAGGTVSIQAGNGTLSNAGLISGRSVNLQSGSSATLNGMVRSNNGAVNIQTGGALIVNQSLTSSNGALNIQVNSGSFTTGQSALLAAIGGSMNLSTLAPASGSVLLNGGANVLGTGNFALNMTSARDLTAGQLFNVTTGNINLTANVGTLQVNNSVIGRADITILHKGIAAQDRIVLAWISTPLN